MSRINLIFFVIIQFVLLFDGSKQSHIKQTTLAVKTIGNTIKNSAGLFRRNKNAIKNLVCGLQKKYLKTRNIFSSKSVKYIGEEGIKKIKYTAPQAATRGNILVGSISEKNILMRSKKYMGGTNLGNLVKKSAEMIRGKELSSLINMVSKNKPQLPLLFFTGGVSKLTQLSVRRNEDSEQLNADGLDFNAFFDQELKKADQTKEYLLIDDEMTPLEKKVAEVHKRKFIPYDDLNKVVEEPERDPKTGEYVNWYDKEQNDLDFYWKDGKDHDVKDYKYEENYRPRYETPCNNQTWDWPKDDRQYMSWDVPPNSRSEDFEEFPDPDHDFSKDKVLDPDWYKKFEPVNLFKDQQNNTAGYGKEWREKQPKPNTFQYYDADGNMQYDATVFRGKKEGPGKHFYTDERLKFEGNFQNDGYHGDNCKVFYENGKVMYDGAINEGTYHGQGKEYYPNGQLLYEGRFKLGGPHNMESLTLYHPSGKIAYQGEMRRGKTYPEGIDYTEVTKE